MSETKRKKMYDKEGTNTSSNDPEMMESRIFVGNLAADKVSRQEAEEVFSKYGKILGVSLHRSYGFVQFDNKESALAAVRGENKRDLHGWKLDICVVTERRKDREPPSSRRSHRSPSPPTRRPPRFMRDRIDRWDRSRSPPPPPPPHLRGPRDLFGRDPFFSPPMRDPYLRPRDDPYDHYPHDHFGRLPPPRDRRPPPHFPHDYPPPPPRDRYEREMMRERDRDRDLLREREREDMEPRREDEIRERPRPPVSDKKTVADMEIIVVNRMQKEYSDMVRLRIETLGLKVDMAQLSPTVNLAEALDNAARRGLLYTIIVTPQHESHRSVTLTILHGRNPQEHKNMPLEDALGLIDRDFERYNYSAEGRYHYLSRGTSSDHNGGLRTGDKTVELMSKAASGDNLSPAELQILISSLQQQQHHKQSMSSRSLEPPDPLPPRTTSTAEDIQRQQADLQAKILSLLGSSAVVPSPKSQTAGPPPPRGYDPVARYGDERGADHFGRRPEYGSFPPVRPGIPGFR